MSDENVIAECLLEQAVADGVVVEVFKIAGKSSPAGNRLSRQTICLGRSALPGFRRSGTSLPSGEKRQRHSA